MLASADELVANDAMLVNEETSCKRPNGSFVNDLLSCFSPHAKIAAMKHFYLAILLFIAAPAWSNKAAPEALEQAQVRIAELTPKINGWKEQIGDFGNESAAKQAVIFNLGIAYTQRAEAYEKIENWKDAAWDWYLADDARRKLVFNQYEGFVGNEAVFRVRQARNQLKAGDLEGAERSMQAARVGKGWGNRVGSDVVVGARINLLLNRPDDAIKDALDAKERTKYPRDCYVALSLAYYHKGDMKKAEANWEEAVKIEPIYAPAKLFDPEAAPLHAAIAQNPKDAKAWFLRGYYYYRAGTNYGTPKFKDAQQLGSWSCQPIDFNHFTPSRANFLDAAQRDYTQSLKLAPDALTLAYRAQALYELAKAPQTEKKDLFAPTSTWQQDVKSARQTGYSNFDAMSALSFVYKLIASDHQKAGKKGEQQKAQIETNFYESLAVLHNPENVLAKPYRNSLVQAADSLILSTQSANTPPAPALKTPEEWKKAGNLAREAGDLSRALQNFRLALVYDPQYADAQNNIGSIYTDVGDYPRGLEALRAAIALDPEHRIAHGNLAKNLFTLNFPKEALEAADNAVKFATTPPLKAWAFEIRAPIRLRLGDHAGTVADLRAQGELDSKTAKPWQLLGKIALLNADIATASEALQKSLAIEPENDFSKVFLAMSLNAAALQNAAKAQNKPAKDLGYSEWERIRPVAQEILKDLRLGETDKNILLDYWNDNALTSALSKRDNSPLRVSCEGVLKTALGIKPLNFVR